MFSFIVGILNGIGWIAYYYLSGGWFEETETPEVRAETIAIIIIVSLVAAIVSAISKDLFENPFFNILHIWMSTAIICTPFYISMIYNLSFWKIVTCFIIWAGVYFAYFATFCAVSAFDLDIRNEVPWYARCLIFSIIMFAATFYPGGHLDDPMIGPGLVICIPVSVIAGIKNTYFD